MIKGTTFFLLIVDPEDDAVDRVGILIRDRTLKMIKHVFERRVSLGDFEEFFRKYLVFPLV